MVCVSDFKLNNKYYISLMPPFRTKELKLRVIIHKLEIKSDTNPFDYVTFSILTSSNEIIDECGLNKVKMPLSCIKKVETLSNILDKLFKNDIIYMIDEYI